MSAFDAYFLETNVRRLEQVIEEETWASSRAADVFAGVLPEPEEEREVFGYALLPGCWADQKKRRKDLIERERHRVQGITLDAIRTDKVGAQSPREWIDWWTKTQKRAPEWLRHLPANVKPGLADWWQKRITLDLVIEVARRTPVAPKGRRSGRREMTKITRGIASRISEADKTIQAKSVSNYLRGCRITLEWIEARLENPQPLKKDEISNQTISA